jgi:ADP-heptose:LPS heptosyltransferase
LNDQSKQPIDRQEGALSSEAKLDGKKVTVVYTIYHHLGDFVVIGGLLKKFDLLEVEFESLAAHRHSPHVSAFDGNSKDRFFDVARVGGFLALIAKLRRQKQEGRLIFGIPMAPGSLQAFLFFWILKKLGALTHIVDFNLINADVLTPPRRRYIFDRHLAQAAELFRHPDWMENADMPLAIACPAITRKRSSRRIGFFPWSGRSWLPEFQWPDGRWLELAKLILKNPDYEIALLGKDNDFARFEHALRSQLPEEMRRHFISSPAESVQSLVAGLRELDCIITVNTSALHLAHALKLPLVALCGSSAEFWLPEGEHVRIVRDTKAALPPSDLYNHDPLQPSLQRIEVDEVYSAFEELSQRARVTGLKIPML